MAENTPVLSEQLPAKTNANLPERGADQRTPSIPQYFSWINNTWEGSTEKQTLINLNFFAWMKRTYGMELKIYLWDAGNFDGPSGGYGDPDSAKFRAQYPNGIGPVVERAAQLGIRMGLWCGPDGFGNTPEEEEKRFNFLLDLCKNYHFALFKIDGACGGLRPEKAAVYAKLLKECRKYCPDLVVLNHRLELHEAEKYVTTFLWQGVETYVDIHSANRETCMHHRGFIFKRGLPDGLERLAEDHGVCISSSVAYFEDDLIYQAFGRSMIMAPEIYANPWLMRDDEFPKLARVYNLHRAAAPILVDGMVLPESCGDNAVSRGTPDHRFIATGHHGWTSLPVHLRLGDEIGLGPQTGKIALIQRHPTEKLIGFYDYNDTADVVLMPFRAHLFEVAPVSEAYPILENCEYEMIREDEAGRPVEVKMLCCEGGTIDLLDHGIRSFFGCFDRCDRREFAPKYLGHLEPCDFALLADRSEELYEAAQFAADNDALERREMKRAGETAIPEVRAARDAFFSQAAYRLRGCDSAAAFDGEYETFFDGWSRYYFGGQRIDGGCLRVDFGETYDADEIRILCFSADNPTAQVPAQLLPETGTVSADLKHWLRTDPVSVTVQNEHRADPILIDGVYRVDTIDGRMLDVSYKFEGTSVRYFRLPCPMDRIHGIRLLKNGHEISLTNPRANNLQAPFEARRPVGFLETEVTLPEVKDGDVLAVAVNGVHGTEGAYCTAEIDGVPVGFPDRAPAYLANMWEYVVRQTDRNYTYYLPLKQSQSGKTVTVRLLSCDGDHPAENLSCDVWLCPKH
ncbi:MAG: hypothetical protein E7576_12940 [Ruminococcaceae bacterium]|jgi:hypothetical protein|nr:hypothetical protein [Oscillospiraceae bacterium]